MEEDIRATVLYCVLVVATHEGLQAAVDVPPGSPASATVRVASFAVPFVALFVFYYDRYVRRGVRVPD
jgi:hypothetical protein